MTENKIIGHIVVESKEAMRAFSRELPVLEKAFKDSGFMQSSLDMSFAEEKSGEWNFNGENREAELYEDFSAMNSSLAASRYDGGFETVAENADADLVLNSMILNNEAYASPKTSVNIFV
jgi:hypothetical protein